MRPTRASFRWSAQAGEVFTPLEVAHDDGGFVTLRCELLNWAFSAFTLRLPLSTPLFSLRERIEDRHGRMSDLKIYVGQASEKTELRGEFAVRARPGEGERGAGPTLLPPSSQRLGELGVGDHAGEDGAVVILYDFTPHHHDNPLLL